MTLAKHDLALLSARFGVARFGAGRFGFIPCENDVAGEGADEPGEYVWKEQTPASQMVVTPWVLQREDCVCRELCALTLSGIIIIPNDQTNRWGLNESSGTRVDSEAALNLTDNNGVTSDDGVISNAAKFDSDQSQYLSRAANGAELYPQGSYMISLWFKPSGRTAFQQYTLITKERAVSSDQAFNLRWFYSFFSATQHINIWWVDTDGHTLLATSENNAAPIDRWNHIAFGYDAATKRGRYRLNGADEVLDLANDPHTALPPTTGTAPFLIGAANRPGTPDKFFDGLIDDVRLYDYVWDNTLIEDVDYTVYLVLSGVVGLVSGLARINWGDGRHDQQNFDTLEDGIIAFTGHYHEPGDYTITVSVTDERGCTATKTLSVTVEVAFSVDVSTAPGSEQGTGFAEVVFTYAVTGGTAPYSYSLDWTGGGGGGPNTDESPTIVFSGTPGAPETIPFTLTVTDDLSAIATFDGTVDVVYEV